MYLLDTAIVNAHILYNECTDSKLTKLRFRIVLVEGLLDGYETAKAELKMTTFLSGRKFDHSRSLYRMAVDQTHVCSDRAGDHRHLTQKSL